MYRHLLGLAHQILTELLRIFFVIVLPLCIDNAQFRSRLAPIALILLCQKYTMELQEFHT